MTTDKTRIIFSGSVDLALNSASTSVFFHLENQRAPSLCSAILTPLARGCGLANTGEEQMLKSRCWLPCVWRSGELCLLVAGSSWEVVSRAPDLESEHLGSNLTLPLGIWVTLGELCKHLNFFIWKMGLIYFTRLLKELNQNKECESTWKNACESIISKWKSRRNVQFKHLQWISLGESG